jgi:uncharacterized protein
MYTYSQRTDVHPVSWNDVHGICKALAEGILPFDPEIILAVGRGGFYPGTLLAHMLQVEIYPVRLSRRVNDVVVFESPKWHVEPPALVDGRRVLIVDEISSTGETLRMVKEKALALGAAQVCVAVLYAHTWGVEVPDYIGLVSDALLLNPWDRQVLTADGWQFHPEYAAALAKQHIAIDPSLEIPATRFKLDKGGAGG